MMPVILWFCLGVLVGGWSVGSIERTVARLDPAVPGKARIVPGMILRRAAAALLLVCALRGGAVCGLAAAAGHILAGRILLAYRAGRI
jgi:hypothetical protein